MGLFGKLFDKKECSICGGEIGLLGNRKLEDGNLCKTCAAKLSPWFSNRRLDEDAGLFMVTSARDLEDANPDVLAFSDVTGCRLDIDESKTEIEYRDAEGERQSFNPPRYAYSYDFYIVINVNNPYFNDIRFQLNSEAVDNDVETLLDSPNDMGRRKVGLMGGRSVTSNAEEVRASVEYRQYEEMGREIRDALLQVRQQAREAVAAAAAPKAAVTCPYCGATTTPDSSGCCEFCGGAVNS